MEGIIYKATNTFNGKVYIGQTICGLAKRRTQHLKSARIDGANRFHNALYQYPSAFEWETIDSFQGTREQVAHALNVAEEYHIIKNRADNPDYGYNASTGGYSCSVFDERLKRMTKKHEGKGKVMLQYGTDGAFIKEWPSLREIARAFSKNQQKAGDLTRGVRYGYMWRVKTNENYPKSIPPAELYQTPTQPVIVYGRDGAFVGKYASCKDAKAALGVSVKVRHETPRDIQLYPNQQTKYFFFADDGGNYPETINVIEYIRPEKIKKDCRIKVAAYDLNGDFVARYDSIAKAMEATGADHKNISHSCKMRHPVIPPNSRTKYVWRFITNDVPEKHIEVINNKAKHTTVRRWRYDDEGRRIGVDINVTEREAETRNKKEHRIIQYSKTGEFIKVWETTYAAVCAGMESTALIRKSLSNIPTAKETHFIWRKYQEGYPTKL